MPFDINVGWAVPTEKAQNLLEINMRIKHIIGGQIIFAIGLFLLYQNSAVFAEFNKGVAQPVLLLLGAFFMANAIFGKETFKKINAPAGLVFLAVGIFGCYDEWYPTLDFITGASPILLLVVGGFLLLCGLKKMA